MVSGPPMTATPKALIPMIASASGDSIPGISHSIGIASALPIGAPSSSEAKNSPPVNPEPMVRAVASALKTNSTSSADVATSCSRLRCIAP